MLSDQIADKPSNAMAFENPDDLNRTLELGWRGDQLLYGSLPTGSSRRLSREGKMFCARICAETRAEERVITAVDPQLHRSLPLRFVAFRLLGRLPLVP